MESKTTQHDRSIPEYYTNSVRLSLSAWDVLMEHGLRGAENEGYEPIFRQRMSLEHAWVFAKILDRTMKHYISEHGRIPLPEELLQELDLDDIYEEEMPKER
jgi:hypothetical protein